MKKIIFCIIFLSLTACINTSIPDNSLSIEEPPPIPGEKPDLVKSENENRLKIRELLLSADAAYTSNNWIEAKKLYTQAESMDVLDERILLRLGNLSIITGDFKNAQKYFVTLLSQDPNNSKAQYNLATVYLAQAEDHFQYYIATLNDESVEEKLFHLLEAIEKFSTNQVQQESQLTPLDSLRKLLEN